MSKSKSRQSSRSASAASRGGSSGTAKSTSTASKTTTEVAVDDVLDTTEKEASAASKTTTKVALDDVPESTERKASTTGKVTSQLAADGVSTGAEKQKSVGTGARSVATTSTSTKSTAAAKTATKSVPTTPAPARSVPVTPVGRAQSRDAAKYERRQVERQMRYLAERRRRRNVAFAITGGVLAFLIIAGVASYFIYQAAQPKHASGPQAPYQEAVFDSTYPPVDNVYCDQLEQSVEHIHVYMVVYINGQPSPLPGNIGIPQDSQTGNSTCFYWLHTHDSSGVIHIESPAAEPFTFGQFLDEWQQEFLSLGFPSELLLPNGWTIWINGHVYKGGLDSIPLAAHNIITIAYNSPKAKPATTYAWNGL